MTRAATVKKLPNNTTGVTPMICHSQRVVAKPKKRQIGTRSATMDPYVRVTLLPGNQSQRTQHVDGGGTDVTWSASHKNVMKLSPKSRFQPQSSTLKVDVYDEDFGCDELIGSCTIPVSPFCDRSEGKLDECSEYMLEYRDDEGRMRAAGALTLSIRFLEDEGDYGCFQVTALHGTQLRDVERDPTPETTDLSQDRTTLHIAAAAVFLYLVTGCVFYTTVERITFIDALYFTIVTLTTVGYGDVLPSSDGSKLFTVFFVLIGIGMIGAALGILSGYVVEQQEARMKAMVKANDAGGKEERDMPHSDDNPWVYLAKSMLTLLLLAGVGAVVMVTVEGMTFVDALYFSVVTMTTVGYGDFSPATQRGRLFAVAYLLVAVLATAKALGSMCDLFLLAKQKQLAQAILTQELDAELLAELDEDGSGCVTEAEFLGKMLVKMGKVGQSDVQAVINQFRAVDVDGSGVLTLADLQQQEQQQQAQRQQQRAAAAASAR